MKPGDLVKMKYEMWWKVRNMGNPARGSYTDQCGIVYSVAGKGIKVLMPDGKIKIGLIDHYDIVQELQ